MSIRELPEGAMSLVIEAIEGRAVSTPHIEDRLPAFRAELIMGEHPSADPQNGVRLSHLRRACSSRGERATSKRLSFRSSSQGMPLAGASGVMNERLAGLLRAAETGH